MNKTKKNFLYFFVILSDFQSFEREVVLICSFLLNARFAAQKIRKSERNLDEQFHKALFFIRSI